MHALQKIRSLLFWPQSVNEIRAGEKAALKNRGQPSMEYKVVEELAKSHWRHFVSLLKERVTSGRLTYMV